MSFNVTNLCAVTCKNSQDQITGLVLFEPRDFTENFLSRLDARKNRDEYKGTKFTLYLPSFLQSRNQILFENRSSEAIETIYTQFLSVKHVGNVFYVRSRLRVVSVDDSPVLLKFLKSVMKDIGYIEVVAQVSDPHKAIETIQKFSPDIITMDIQMPGKTGVEVVKDLLLEKYYPVLMISSLALEEGSLVFDALNNGAFDYIQKPKLEEKESFKDELANKILCAVESRSKPLTNAKKIIIGGYMHQHIELTLFILYLIFKQDPLDSL